MAEFHVGDLVKFFTGSVPHEVVAVHKIKQLFRGDVACRYDVVSRGPLSAGRRHQGVASWRLMPYKEEHPNG